MATRPTLEQLETLDGTEMVVVRKDTKPYRTLLSRIIGLVKPLRIERYTAVTNASGIATFTFSPAFVVAPDVQLIDGWSGDQLIAGGVASVTKTGCSVQAKVSRGTLLLTSGPFQTAGAGVSVTIRAIGN